MITNAANAASAIRRCEGREDHRRLPTGHGSIGHGPPHGIDADGEEQDEHENAYAYKAELSHRRKRSTCSWVFPVSGRADNAAVSRMCVPLLNPQVSMRHLKSLKRLTLGKRA